MIELNLLKPQPFSLSNGTDNRDPDTYLQVISQFDVVNNPRYQPDNIIGTKCNFFVWDVTRALACEIPHWWLGQESTANKMINWLTSNDGTNNGWKECNLHTAQANALNGMPTIVGYYNSSGQHGHIAMMLPAGTIAQAGLSCFIDKSIQSGFGNLPIQFFVHA